MTQFLIMEEGPVTMNGSDAQALRPLDDNTRPRRYRWLWTLVTLTAVIAVGIVIRLVGAPQAVAQAPIVKPGSATAPARPINSATPNRQAQPAAGQQPAPVMVTPTRTQSAGQA